MNFRKSGILNKKVTPITVLKTVGEAIFSGNTFKRIRTIVIGYININAGKAITMI